MGFKSTKFLKSLDNYIIYLLAKYNINHIKLNRNLTKGKILKWQKKN